MSTEISLDGTDRRLLDALQRNGRSTFDELAEHASLSSSATLRRARTRSPIDTIPASAPQAVKFQLDDDHDPMGDTWHTGKVWNHYHTKNMMRGTLLKRLEK